MGSSDGTFSKREKEKIRQKKKKDKLEKKDERKANLVKGLKLDQMLAYVDENGNISNTPPDPRKSRPIDQQDIRIGIARQEEQPPADSMSQGTVTFFNTAKGYGFIRDQQTQESVFVHINGLIDSIQENDKVTFERVLTPKGPSAIEVKKIP